MPEEGPVATKRCPYCAEQIRAAAIKCRYCGSTLGSPLGRSWHRQRQGKMLAGVCAGLAEEFGISVTILRLAFLLGTLLGGPGLVVYAALWVIMPYAEEPTRPQRPGGARVREALPPQG